jgi:hypothetical protein
MLKPDRSAEVLHKGAKALTKSVKGKKAKPSTFNLHEYQQEWLDLVATRQITKSAIIRQAIKEYMERNDYKLGEIEK